MTPLVSEDLVPIWRAHPLVLVDVGAAGGLQRKWRALKPYMRVIGFEPDRRTFEALDGSGDEVRWINAAVGAGRQRRLLYLTRKPECSSVYPPNRLLLDRYPDADRFDVVETRQIDVQPLAEVLEREGIEDVDFLKIDVQGFERDVLKGAGRYLERRLLGIEVELEFQPIYEGQPLFGEVHGFLTQAGFELLDLCPTAWKRRFADCAVPTRAQVMFADALYFRPLEALGSLSGGPDAAAKLLHAAGVYLVHGYRSHALALRDAHRNLFTPRQQDSVAAALQSWRRPGRSRRFPGRRRLHRAVARLADALAPDR